MKITGRVWKYSIDDIDTDQLHLSMYSHLPIEEQAKHCLEWIDPEFARNVEKGDVLVAGKNFGCGSARPAQADLLQLGIAAVVAESFDRKFFRNALSSGLLAMPCPGVLEVVEGGEQVEIDPAEGTVVNLATGRRAAGPRLPAFLRDMAEMGGEKAYLKVRLARERELGGSV